MNANTDEIPTEIPTVELPNTLYHYCGVNGFYGIVTSKEVWLSSATFTNDYTEGKQILRKAKSRLESANNQPFANQLENAICTPSITRTPFIACFSSKCDVLSQWRGYADDGAGFAVGFSIQALANQCETFRTQVAGIYLDRIYYNDHEHDGLLENCLNQHLNDDRAARQEGCNGIIGQLSAACEDIEILGGFC